MSKADLKRFTPKLRTLLPIKNLTIILRVGDFRTRLDAQRLLNELKAISQHYLFSGR